LSCLQEEEGSGCRAAVEALKEEMGLEQLESFRVVHCAHAFGVVLRSRDGWKLALSGDTRPCDAVVEAAKGATVLIHEVPPPLPETRRPRGRQCVFSTIE
jgi:ribonuclease Z